MRFQIRETNDEALIRKLHARTFPSDEFYDRPSNVYWVAREQKTGKVAGFAILTPWESGCAFLSRAGVLPKYRGHKLQRALIRVRENYARRHLIEYMLTYTSKDNIPSFVSLIKSNYELYEPTYAYVGRDVFYFRKKLL